ncbi:hypothetical protein FQR65_LT19556 [Abscondita terminalis]|nr:hypothetical protein FQR65_LT19556 [Abscondita terminalis]
MNSDDSIGDPDYSPSSDESSDNQDILESMKIRQPFVKLKRLQQHTKIASDKNRVKTKQSYCMFCFKTISKLPRHLELVHASEERVKHFLVLPKNSSERKALITSIRNDGNFIYNTQIQSDGNVLCSRRRRYNQDVEYVPCGICKGFFSKNTLRRHFKKCARNNSDKSEKPGNCMVAARRLLGKVHPKASDV